MISSIEITRFRGIREGKLEDLSPLTVLVGPNGCGKSTVLDGLLVAASPKTGEGIGQAVIRHHGVKQGARWLLWKTGADGPAEVAVSTRAGGSRSCTLSPNGAMEIRCAGRSEMRGTKAESYKICVEFDDPESYKTLVRSSAPVPLDDVPDVRMLQWLDDRTRTPLDQLLTECIERGQRSEAKRYIKELVPGVQDILILTENGSPIVHIEYATHSVPAALCGDGIHSLLRTSLELAARPNGVVLIEEPEIHQHPGGVQQTVRAILAAIRRDIQVVLTTHSLELIDLLLAESSDDDIEQLSLYRLELEDGRLIAVRTPGSEVQFSRTEIESDLR